MNLIKLMSQVEARDDALLDKREEADQAYNVAAEIAHRELTFDDLLETLDDLPEEIKEKSLQEAAQGKSTELLADAYDRFLEKKTGHLLDRVIYCTQQINRYNEIINHFYLNAPEKCRETLSSEEK